MNERKVNALIELLYGAALDRSLWPSFLEAYGTLLRSTPIALQFHDVRNEAANAELASGADPELLREYDEYYGARNVFVARGKRLFRTGLVITGSEICSDADLVKTEYYNDYMKRVNSFHALATVFFHEQDRLGFLVANRRRAAGAYDDAEIRMATMLSTHVQRAFQVHTRMSEADQANRDLRACFDATPWGVVIVRHDFRVVHVNHAAKEIAASRDGLTIDDGLLAATTHAHTRSLHRLIASATAENPAASSGRGLLRMRRSSGAKPLELLVAPLRDSPGSPSRRAIVFVSDPDRVQRPLEDSLRDLYALTPAEARLARAILDGASLASVAERLGVARNTVKTQLDSLFRKVESTGREN